MYTLSIVKGCIVRWGWCDEAMRVWFQGWWSMKFSVLSGVMGDEVLCMWNGRCWVCGIVGVVYVLSGMVDEGVLGVRCQ